jgi:hypothetical protein
MSEVLKIHPVGRMLYTIHSATAEGFYLRLNDGEEIEVSIEKIKRYPKILSALLLLFNEMKAHNLPIEDRVCRLVEEVK